MPGRGVHVRCIWVGRPTLPRCVVPPRYENPLGPAALLHSAVRPFNATTTIAPCAAIFAAPSQVHSTFGTPTIKSNTTLQANVAQGSTWPRTRSLAAGTPMFVVKYEVLFPAGVLGSAKSARVKLCRYDNLFEYSCGDHLDNDCDGLVGGRGGEEGVGGGRGRATRRRRPGATSGGGLGALLLCCAVPVLDP